MLSLSKLSDIISDNEVIQYDKKDPTGLNDRQKRIFCMKGL